MIRFTLLIATAAAFAVMVGTAAAGGTRPDDRPTHGPGAVGADPPTLTPSTRPDDRPTHGPGAISSELRTGVVRPDDRAWRGVGPVPTIEVIRTPSVQGDGFDWADAAIGAAAALALGLLAGASALALRRHRVAAVS